MAGPDNAVEASPLPWGRKVVEMPIQREFRGQSKLGAPGMEPSHSQGTCPQARPPSWVGAVVSCWQVSQGEAAPSLCLPRRAHPVAY